MSHRAANLGSPRRRAWPLLTALALTATCSPEQPPLAGAPPRLRPSDGSAAPAEAAAVSAATPAGVDASAGPAAPGAPPVLGADPSPPIAQEPALLSADGALLPQTEERPRHDTPLFGRRLDRLFGAIVADDPEPARTCFFPKRAYEAVKDIARPGRDWESRLWRRFGRDVHDYHQQLGPHPEGARLRRLELDERRVKWMKPGSEGNRLGYYRVTRSRLWFSDGSGTERQLELTSLISWRGEWYVVHLHGFR